MTKPFQLVAGHPVLDLVNTLDWRFRETGPEELLDGYDDLLRVRHLFGQVLGARRVAAMAPAIRGVADRALDRIAAACAGGAPVDFITEFAVPVPAAIIGEIVGVPEADARRMLAENAASVYGFDLPALGVISSQGGLDLDEVRGLSDWATDGRWPATPV